MGPDTTFPMSTPQSQVAALPNLAMPWRSAFETGSSVGVDVLHLTDPLCPWSYSFEPTLRAIEARYGDQLHFQTAMIDLVESVKESAEECVSRRRDVAQAILGFRRFGMPITPHLRSRAFASEAACRLVKAAERQDPLLAEALLRLLRLAAFTTGLMLDETEVLANLCDRVDGLNAAEAIEEMHSEWVGDAYLRDRATAREPSEIAIKLGRSNGASRYSAPTLILRNEAGLTAVVPGFQPLEAVEVALVNLEPRLTRLPAPSIETLLAAYPGGLTSQEIARVLADTTSEPQRAETELALLELAAEGHALRAALADDALWTLGSQA
jgi:predicted DsbA family dithiol-disulfide isomerase